MTTATDIELILESIADDLLPCKYCNTGAGYLAAMCCCKDEAFMCHRHLVVKRSEFEQITSIGWLRCQACGVMHMPGSSFTEIVDLRPV